MIATPIRTQPFEAAPPHLKRLSLNRYRDEYSRLAEAVPMLRLAHPNVLIVGTTERADRAFEQIRPYLLTPCATWDQQAISTDLAPCRTMVVRNAETLNEIQQTRLLDLMYRTANELQVVTMSSAPLFPLVEAGRFLDSLYYQLNVVFLELTGEPQVS